MSKINEVTGTLCALTCAFFAFGMLMSTSLHANTPTYETLEQYCVAVEADTPENCACGQTRAEQLLTPEEMQLVLGLMTEDPQAMQQFLALGPKGPLLMQKVDQITQGCDG